MLFCSNGLGYTSITRENAATGIKIKAPRMSRTTRGRLVAVTKRNMNRSLVSKVGRRRES